MIGIIYTLFYLIPLVLLAASAFLPQLADITGLETPGVTFLVMIAIAVVPAVVINVRNKIRVIIVGGFLALAAGFLLVTDKVKRQEWFEENSWFFVALILSVAAVVVVVAMLRLRAVKIASAVLLAGLLICSYWTEIIDTKTGVVSIVFICSLVILEEIRNYFRKSDNMQTYVVRIVPFLCIGAFILCLIPAKEEPYDWAAFRSVWDRITEAYTGVLQFFEGDSTKDMEATLGFSEKGHILGSVSDDPKVMMTLTLGHTLPGYVYLDGKYFEEFDGREWKESKETYSYMLDTVEAGCALSQVDTEVLHDYMKRIDITVMYFGQNSRYVFAPVKTFIANRLIKEPPVFYDGNELTFGKKMGSQTLYRTEYVMLNRDENIFPKLIELGKQTDRELWELESYRCGLKNGECTYDDYLEYKNSLYSGRYGRMSDKNSLSQGVTEFLDKALEGAETDYEKLVALEKAFADFEYTSSPGALPKWVDSPSEFLDYFILDSRKGFCTSFATAFVLLCRAEEIPARYVQGYYVPTEDRHVLSVYSSMAHAYPEAYIDGVGWIVFEPTPGKLTDSAWAGIGPVKKSENNYKPENREDEDFELSPSPMPTEEPFLEPEDEKTGISWYVIVLPVSLCILVLIVIVLVERIVNIRHFNRLERDEKAYAICMRIVNILKRKGLVKEDGETVREFAERALSGNNTELDVFADVLEKILYSKSSIDENEISALEAEYEKVKEGLKGRELVAYRFLSFMGLN